jgi:sugar phosphate isomerase/epimerase
MLTRRDWLKATIATAAAMPFASPGSAWAGAGQERARIRGVRMALQSASFSFSGLGLPDIFKTMQGLGLTEIDIMSEHIEHLLGAPGIQLPGAGRPGPWARPATPPPGPPPVAGTGTATPATPGTPAAPAARPAGRGMDPAVREALRAWRLSVDLAKFRDVKAQFDRAGLILFSYNLSFNDSYTDPEIERGMLIAKALGTRIITASSPLTVMPRVAPLAEKHDVVVALHNHMEGPEEFEKAMALSPKIWVNLDVGHFFAMGHDPVAYLRAHHRRITNIHVKDRMSNRGREQPFGEGETPLREVLTLVRDQKYDMPVCLEYVGPDGPAIELKRCLDYCRKILEG